MTKFRVGIAAVTLGAVLFAAGALQPLAVRGESGDPVAGSVEFLEAKLADGTADARDHAALALEYLSRLRTQADPTVIPAARRLLHRSFDLQPNDNFAAALGMASLSNASHDFSTSVKWSRKAIEMNPFNSGPYGLLGDALFELGHTREADAAYQKMIDIRPDVGSYIRASYSAQFHKDYEGARYALRLALDAAPAVGETPAFIQHQLGDIYSTLRRFKLAERANRLGTELAPGYVPPTVGVAESFISRGRYEEALPIMERAVENLPSLEYIVTLGDLYWALGDETAARATYDRAARKFALYRANGVLPDHDFVTFYADYGYRIAAALEEARAIYENRPTPAAADTLAWALHAAGRDRAGMRYAEEAIRRETLPDGSQHFHAAVIAKALGDRDAARAYARRALKIDPRFSLFHLEAAERLAR